MKQTAVTFRQAKGQRKLAMLTAYDATVARLMDDHVDAVLVGDSLGMVMLGQPDTLSVTMDQMIHHSAAVSRGLTKPLLVCDMPFMSYHLSPQQACANAGRLVQPFLPAGGSHRAGVHPGHGASGPHAAIPAQHGRLQGPGPGP